MSYTFYRPYQGRIYPLDVKCKRILLQNAECKYNLGPAEFDEFP